MYIYNKSFYIHIHMIYIYMYICISNHFNMLLQFPIHQSIFKQLSPNPINLSYNYVQHGHQSE